MSLKPLSKSGVAKQWREKLKPKRNKKKHSYKHFDLKIINPVKFLGYVSDEEKMAIHSFLPLVRFLKKKYKYKNINGKRKLTKKKREIMYASHLDALIYVWYQCILEQKYENFLAQSKLENSVLAYRKIKDPINDCGKCNINFANEVFASISDECVALTFDISNFFPSLSHDLLKEKWCHILDVERLPQDHFNIYKSLTKYAFVDLTDKGVRKILKMNTRGLRFHSRSFCGDGGFSGSDFRELKKNIKELKNGKKVFQKNSSFKGIPQGTPMSGLLANIYLIDFDLRVNEEVAKSTGIYRRYSDDIIVVCPKSEAQKLEHFIRNEISKVKDNEGYPFLTIKEEKTDRILFEKEDGLLTAWLADNKYEKKYKKSLQYLGFEFDGKRTFLRSGSIAKYYNRMQYGLKKTIGHHRKGPLLKRKLFSKFTALGRSNFICYSKKAKNIMLNNRISKQLKKNWRILSRGLKGRD